MTVPTGPKHIDASPFPAAPTGDDAQHLVDDDKYTLLHPPPNYTDPEDQVVVLSLHKGNTIRFTGVDDPLAQALNSTAASTWPAGIKESRWRGGETSHMPKYFKLKLDGFPFVAAQSDASAIGVRRLICALLRTLLEHGWKVDGVADCSLHRWGTMSSLVLMRAEPRVLREGDMFAIAFGDMDRMCLIDAPETAATIVLRTIVECWGMGLKSTIDCHGATGYQLRGRPWFGGALVGGVPMQDFAARVMMAKALYRLKSIGFRLYATMDLSNGDEPPSWILVRSGSG